jgi:heme-degrading monooxygenase HmoA
MPNWWPEKKPGEAVRPARDRSVAPRLRGIIRLILKYQDIEVLGRSRVMEARVVDLRVVPTEAREMVRIYRDSVLPAARHQHGFGGALLLTDDDTGLGISITLWETEEDRQEGEANGFYQEQIRKFSDLLTETPVRKHYNVGVIHYDASVLA